MLHFANFYVYICVTKRKFIQDSFMKNIFFTLLGVIALPSVMLAQNSFKVVAIKNAKENLKSSGQMLKVGETIALEEKISIGKNGFVGLSYSKGGTVQINKEGTYKLGDLEKKLISSKQSSTEKYVSLVIGEVVKSGDANSPYNQQKVTGSVERALSLNGAKRVLETKRFKNKYDITLENASEGYKITLISPEGTQIKSFETKEQNFSLDFSDEKLAKPVQIRVIVQPLNVEKQKMESGFVFKKQKPAFIEATQKEWDALKNNHKNSELSPAEIKLEEAVFWENKGCDFEAMEAYQEAKNINPDEPMFALAYDEYLKRKK